MGSRFGENLSLAVQALGTLDDSGWTPDRILSVLKGVAETTGLKLGDVMQPVRVALTGSTVSEPVNELLSVVGRNRSLEALKNGGQRLQRAMHPA
jgi:glutamyl-tRNA synthetase